MKQYSKDELQRLVTTVSKKVSKTYIGNPNTGNSNMDAMEILAETMVQIQRNCENIIVEVLDNILNN